MTLNVKALLPTPEHPVQTEFVSDDKVAAHSHDKAFDPHNGAKEKALDDWHEEQKRRLKESLLHLLDVL